MAAGSRSRNGCWTCRLRRKKCDERRPLCSICESLGIGCDGYGQRPEWMDGGEKEKEAATETRRKIKSAARRESSNNGSRGSPSLGHMVSSDPSQKAEQTPKPEVNTEDEVAAEVQLPERTTINNVDLTSQWDIGTCFGTFPNLESALPQFSDGPSRDETALEHRGYALPRIIREREASLLMFYLDCVFPMQFKMYSPSIAEGGRGWIMSLFLRTPPLYHVTLAMSAHCLDLRSLPASGNEYKTISFNELGLALRHLQQYIYDFNNRKDPGNLEENVKVCACILQMIAFACFKGGTDNWKMHLQAASSIVPVLIDAILSLPPVSQSPYTTTLPAASDILAYQTDEAAMKFLTGVFVWFDICSPVSTGAKPYLESHFERLLSGSDPKISLRQVMGVEGWVMILIGKIASLDHWKRESQKHGRLSMIDLVLRATAIENDLKSGLSALEKSPSKLDTNPEYLVENIGRIPLANLSIHARYVTQIYALAAVIYLHVIVSGPLPELPEIRGSVSSTIGVLMAIPDPMLARAMLWPLLITGSMALKDEEQFFKKIIFSSGISETSSMSPGWNVLQVLEECWRMRGSHGHVPGGNGHWASVMSSIGVDMIVY